LRHTWTSVFGKSWSPARQVVPKLSIFQPDPRSRARRSPIAMDEFHNAWSGSVCRSPFDLSINGNVSVTGQWLVPTVSKPLNNRQPGPIVGLPPTVFGWDSSSWIGIDGFGPDSTDVLQAGVQHYVLSTGEIVYLAWFEWYVPQHLDGEPAYVNQTTITNLAVHPGDALSCNVSYVNHQYGTISFSNMTTGQWFSMALAPPVNASFNAQSIEWIFEAPSGGWQDGAIVPDFTDVVFTNAFGCGGGAGDLIDPQSGLKLLLKEGNPLDPFVQTSVRTDTFAVTISQH
jgi:Peptidase A4 family